jgi:hypothetical protein
MTTLQMLITRRDWLLIAAASAPVGLARPRSEVGANQRNEQAERESRIERVIRAYGEQGFHRTGSETDKRSGDWLCDEVRVIGLDPSREAFSLNLVEPVVGMLVVGERRIEGLPLFDGAFTGASGVRGQLGALDGDAPIGLTEAAPNTAAAGPLGAARRANRHKAIVCVTRGGRPGLCPSNADFFLDPFGPPVLQVSSEESSWLTEQARAGAEAQLIAQVRRKQAQAFNVTAKIQGTDSNLLPLVVMTPRSGWWSCASERGGGIACWLELMRALRANKPARDVLFVASSGHELGHLGINAFVDRRPGVVKKSVAWIHLGANIGAATDPGNTLQSSDDELEAKLASAMTSAGLRVDRRIPRGTIPAGEAEVVHRGSGRYVSVIGRNAFFHNPADRGPEVIDRKAIARFVDAFTTMAKTLAGA